MRARKSATPQMCRLDKNWCASRCWIQCDRGSTTRGCDCKPSNVHIHAHALAQTRSGCQINVITFLVKAQAEVCPGSAIGALQISGWEIIKLNLFDQERPWHVSRWRGKHSSAGRIARFPHATLGQNAFFQYRSSSVMPRFGCQRRVTADPRTPECACVDAARRRDALGRNATSALDSSRSAAHVQHWTAPLRSAARSLSLFRFFSGLFSSAGTLHGDRIFQVRALSLN